MRAAQLKRDQKYVDLLTEGLVGSIPWGNFPIQIFALWDGEVRLPVLPEEGTRLRLVVAEFEEYLVDDELPFEVPSLPGLQVSAYDDLPTKKDRRLVFVEHIELQ